MIHVAHHTAHSSRQGFDEAMKAYLPEVVQGLLLALAFLGWLTIEYAAGLQTTRLEQHWLVTNFYVIIPAILIWRAVKHRRDVLEGGKLLWWQGMTSGMLISVVAAALRAPTWWFFLKFIHPGYMQGMIEFAVQGGLKRELAEVDYHPTIIMIQSTLSPVLHGFFLTLGATTIARSKTEKTETKPAEAQ